MTDDLNTNYINRIDRKQVSWVSASSPNGLRPGTLRGLLERTRERGGSHVSISGAVSAAESQQEVGPMASAPPVPFVPRCDDPFGSPSCGPAHLDRVLGQGQACRWPLRLSLRTPQTWTVFRTRHSGRVSVCLKPRRAGSRSKLALRGGVTRLPLKAVRVDLTTT